MTDIIVPYCIIGVVLNQVRSTEVNSVLSALTAAPYITVCRQDRPGRKNTWENTKAYTEKPGGTGNWSTGFLHHNSIPVNARMYLKILGNLCKNHLFIGFRGTGAHTPYSRDKSLFDSLTYKSLNMPALRTDTNQTSM